MQTDKVLAQFKLLGSVLKQPDHAEFDSMMEKLSKLIDIDIPELLKRNAPPDSYDLYTDFQAYYEQFYEFVLYSKLLSGKSVVALGGGFSSGKSSFLNALDGENALPDDVIPTTSVPTFIINGNKHEVYAVNNFNNVIPFENVRDIRSISHSFGEIKDDDDNIVSEPIELGYILKSLLFATPKQSYANLAFVDTPGYSKADSDSYSKKTDEHIARSQLDESNFNIIFIQATAGTLSEDDIRFIKSLKPDIPRMFILSMADLKTDDELMEIKEHIKMQFATGGIANMNKPAELYSFSKLKPDEYDSESIRSVISEWNKTQDAPQFSRSFKKLFIKCRSYYENEIEYQRQRLERINTALTQIIGFDEALAPLQESLRDARKSVDELKEVADHLAELSKLFFTELKKVCDNIGISMHEPSERDMYEDIPDALELMKEYKHLHGISSGNKTYKKLMFKDITPVLDNAIGGYAHKESMVRLLRNFILTDKVGSVYE